MTAHPDELGRGKYAAFFAGCLKRAQQGNPKLAETMQPGAPQ